MGLLARNCHLYSNWFRLRLFRASLEALLVQTSVSGGCARGNIISNLLRVAALVVLSIWLL